MKYVGRSSTAPEHKAIKERPGKCSQLEIWMSISLSCAAWHLYTSTYTLPPSSAWEVTLNVLRRVCRVWHTSWLSKTQEWRQTRTQQHSNTRKQTKAPAAVLPSLAVHLMLFCKSLIGCMPKSSKTVGFYMLWVFLAFHSQATGQGQLPASEGSSGMLLCSSPQQPAAVKALLQCCLEFNKNELCLYTVALQFFSFCFVSALPSIILMCSNVSHNLEGSQGFTFTSLAAAAAQGWMGPGATRDLICLCKQTNIYFPLWETQKDFILMRMVKPFELLDLKIRFYSMSVSSSLVAVCRMCITSCTTPM